MMFDGRQEKAAEIEVSAAFFSCGIGAEGFWGDLSDFSGRTHRAHLLEGETAMEKRNPELQFRIPFFYARAERRSRGFGGLLSRLRGQVSLW